jgi:hypothetical protein
MMSSMVHDDESRRIYIEFPKDTHPYRLDDIKAVPETYWHGNEQYFSIHGLLQVSCAVLCDITSLAAATKIWDGQRREHILYPSL